MPDNTCLELFVAKTEANRQINILCFRKGIGLKVDGFTCPIFWDKWDFVYDNPGEAETPWLWPVPLKPFPWTSWVSNFALVQKTYWEKSKRSSAFVMCITNYEFGVNVLNYLLFSFIYLSTLLQLSRSFFCKRKGRKPGLSMSIDLLCAFLHGWEIDEILGETRGAFRPKLCPPPVTNHMLFVVGGMLPLRGQEKCSLAAGDWPWILKLYLYCMCNAFFLCI